MIPIESASISSAQYAYRRGLFSRQRRFWLEPHALGFSRGRQERRICYSEVDTVRLYRLFMRGPAAIEKKIMWRVHLHCRSGEWLVLSPLHYSAALGSWEDRSFAYAPFVRELLGRLRTADPNLSIVTKHHWTMRLRRHARRNMSALGGTVLLKLLRVMRRYEPGSVANAAGRLARALGPWLRGHRVAGRNLMAAFPEKSAQEIESIVRGTWDNLGRVIAEYAFLDRLWDFDPGASGRIVIDPPVLDRVGRMRESGMPVLLFSAHLANWELCAVALAALGLKLAVVYRPPDFAPVAKEIRGLREQSMGYLIPAGPGAATRLKRVLAQGISVGMLVDQHFASGIDVMFFGRSCKVNPTLARFARLTGHALHGVRTVRLPAGRFRIELSDALTPPRDREGEIDVAGTMQMITSVVEGWVREHPEQWLWMHRRWR